MRKSSQCGVKKPITSKPPFESAGIDVVERDDKRPLANLDDSTVSDRRTLGGLTQFPFGSSDACQQTIETTAHVESNMREGRKFYCDVLGGKITKAEDERDFVRLGDDFYIGFLYGDVPDESEFLRTARSVWLEIKADNVEEMSRQIVESGLVRKLDVPDSHLYFQAPGGNACGSSELTRTSRFMRGPEEARTWQK